MSLELVEYDIWLLFHICCIHFLSFKKGSIILYEVCVVAYPHVLIIFSQFIRAGVTNCRFIWVSRVPELWIRLVLGDDVGVYISWVYIEVKWPHKSCVERRNVCFLTSVSRSTCSYFYFWYLFRSSSQLSQGIWGGSEVLFRSISSSISPEFDQEVASQF